MAGGHDRHGCTTARRRRDRKRAVRARDHAPMMLACAHAMPRTELLPADPPAWRGLRRRTRRRPARAPLRGAARRSRVLGPAVQRGQPRGHCPRRKPERCSARRFLPRFVRGIARPPERGDRAPRCEHDRRHASGTVALRPARTICNWISDIGNCASAERLSRLKSTKWRNSRSSVVLTSWSSRRVRMVSRSRVSSGLSPNTVTGRSMPSRASSCSERNLSRARRIASELFGVCTPIISNWRTTAVP